MLFLWGYMASATLDYLYDLVFFLAIVSIIGWFSVMFTIMLRFVAHLHYRPRTPFSEVTERNRTINRVLSVLSYSATRKASNEGIVED